MIRTHEFGYICTCFSQALLACTCTLNKHLTGESLGLLQEDLLTCSATACFLQGDLSISSCLEFISACLRLHDGRNLRLEAL